MKATGCQPVESTSLSKVMVSDGSTCTPYTVARLPHDPQPQRLSPALAHHARAPLSRAEEAAVGGGGSQRRRQMRRRLLYHPQSSEAVRGGGRQTRRQAEKRTPEMYAPPRRRRRRRRRRRPARRWRRRRPRRAARRARRRLSRARPPRQPRCNNKPTSQVGTETDMFQPEDARQPRRRRPAALLSLRSFGRGGRCGDTGERPAAARNRG